MRKRNFKTISLILISILLVDVTFAGLPGTLDTTFGSGGIASFTPPNGGFFEALGVQPDGKIVLGGRWNSEFGLVRFKTKQIVVMLDVVTSRRRSIHG